MPSVTASQVKELREMTSAGMMDCKRALEATEGDVERAKDWLREKGLVKAAGKSGRSTNEGTVEAYVHASGGLAKLGVLVEVNCESDFVAKTDDFRQLARELALQVAGMSTTQYVGRDEVPAELVEREMNVYRAQMAGKPDNIIEKILTGKIDAFYSEVCLLEQPWIRNEGGGKKKVNDLVQEAIAKLGENISVARFARFHVGESRSGISSSETTEG
ncbi:MAG: translation elongation factor Ts [Candidatus Dormibacteria bacterium]